MDKRIFFGRKALRSKRAENSLLYAYKSLIIKWLQVFHLQIVTTLRCRLCGDCLSCKMIGTITAKLCECITQWKMMALSERVFPATHLHSFE